MKEHDQKKSLITADKNSLPIAPYERNGQLNNHLSTSSSLLVNLSGCIRLAMDFGLCPQLVSEKIISELLKMIVENRENDKEKKMSATYISSFHSDFNSTSISNPAHFSSPFSPSSSSSTFKPTISSSVDCKSYKSGLGFCEFIELIAAIAVEGLKTEEKNLFPTAFSKVIN